jgi:Tol biopolymer transport system component
VAVSLRDALRDRYVVERELGPGGMATVYLAQDVRHDREVALKVLRPELAAVIGAERFLAEIKVTAHLQHPHILPLFDSGAADGFLFYVMPYVEGESLRERLNRDKQLPVEDAVRIAREVASALDYAHRHHVVHRDIKPENILLHDEQALVADFGIALAVSAAGGTRMTETGMSLGTPHYMSPEQAMGEREVTAKSDVYALGCVLYEMLVGEPPFTGPTAQAIIARVVTEEPRSITIQRKTVPAHVEVAVLRALAKLPADRFATAALFAEALDAPGALATLRVTAPRAATKPHRAASIPSLVAISAAALVAGIVAGRATRGAQHSAASVGRFVITAGSDHRLSGGPYGTVALSPDGASLVYVALNPGGNQLYLRRMDELTASPIPGTEGGVNPFFSPDGRWITYFVGNGLKKIALAGGAPVAIQTGSLVVQGAVWLDAGTMAITPADGSLRRLNGDGTTTLIAAPDSAIGERALLPAAVLPGGHVILAMGLAQGRATGRAIAINVRSGARKVLLEGITFGVAYNGGYLAWVQPDGALLAAPFDIEHLAITGAPVTIAQGVRVPVGGAPQFHLSPTGSLVYVPEFPFDLALVDRAGRWRAIADIKRRFHSPRFSPDGRHIAVDFSQQGSRDVWTLDLQQHTLSRLTFENDGHDPVWLPDGRRVAYLTARGGVIGIFLRNADGSGTAESLFVGRTNLTAGAFTPDGNELIAVGAGRNGVDNDLVMLPLAGDRTPRPLLATPFNEAWPALSPDGRWLAYQSDESGESEVYVRPFPGPGAKVLVSQNGGSEPVWSRDSRELFYRGFGPQGTPLVAVAVRAVPEFQVLSRTTLFEAADFEGAQPHANYDVSPDGRSFVMVRQGPLSEIVLVQNWPEEARRRGAASPR